MHSPLSDKSGRNYDQQIDQRLRALRPNPQGDIALAKTILEAIRKELQNKDPYTQAEFKMAGSLEKDTMLTSRKEIDVIISFPREHKLYPATEISRQNILDGLSTFYNVPRREKQQHHNIIIQKSGHKVDLLPTFKLSLDEFSRLTQRQKHIYKPHMSILHVDFIKSRGKKFQEFVRLVKYWAHGPSEQDRKKHTSSFFLELIAADVYDRFPEIRFIQLFEQFLRRMKNIQKRKKSRGKFIGFKDHYKPLEYRNKWLDKLTVLDPVDFDDNIFNKGPQNENLQHLVTRARKSLKLWDEKSFGEVFSHYFNRQPL